MSFQGMTKERFMELYTGKIKDVHLAWAEIQSRLKDVEKPLLCEEVQTKKKKSK